MERPLVAVRLAVGFEPGLVVEGLGLENIKVNRCVGMGLELEGELLTFCM